MIECSCRIDADVQKELSLRTYTGSLIAMVAGAVGLLCYIVLATAMGAAWTDALLVFAVPFAVGLILLITVRRNIKAAGKQAHDENFYRFDADSATIETRSDGAVKATAVMRYIDFVRKRETKSFFLLYVNRFSVMPVRKSSLTPDEQAVLRGWLFPEKSA